MLYFNVLSIEQIAVAMVISPAWQSRRKQGIKSDIVCTSSALLFLGQCISILKGQVAHRCNHVQQTHWKYAILARFVHARILCILVHSHVHCPQSTYWKLTKSSVSRGESYISVCLLHAAVRVIGLPQPTRSYTKNKSVRYPRVWRLRLSSWLWACQVDFWWALKYIELHNFL